MYIKPCATSIWRGIYHLRFYKRSLTSIKTEGICKSTLFDHNFGAVRELFSEKKCLHLPFYGRMSTYTRPDKCIGKNRQIQREINKNRYSFLPNCRRSRIKCTRGEITKIS